MQALEILIAKISSIVTTWAVEQYKVATKTKSSSLISLEASLNTEIVVALCTLPDVEILDSTQAGNNKQDILEFINYL